MERYDEKLLAEKARKQMQRIENLIVTDDEIIFREYLVSELEKLQTDLYFLSGGLLTLKGLAELCQRVEASEQWIDEFIAEMKGD